MFFAGEALDFLIKKYRPAHVLDVGCGDGKHTREFLGSGISVCANDIYIHPNLQVLKDKYGDSLTFVNRNFNDGFQVLSSGFDCIWASHVLEHQLNPQGFLEKCFHLLNDENGVFAVTVPPMKSRIVGGHVSLWNAGLLLYRLVLAGFDCSDAHVKSYGYNISVVVRKKARPPVQLKYDSGDITTLAPYFPTELNVSENFEGNISECNWS